MEQWMPIFKVVDKTVKLSTRGKIDFIDLSETVQQAVALIKDIKVFLEQLAPKRRNYASFRRPFTFTLHAATSRENPAVNRGASGVWDWQSLLYVETDVSQGKEPLLFKL
jgi:thiamine phosphate synthase YjbQ (UPF0047 family)